MGCYFRVEATWHPCLLRKLKSLDGTDVMFHFLKVRLSLTEHTWDCIIDTFCDNPPSSFSNVACVLVQSGRCDGYILEGKELEFYQKMLAKKKSK